MLYDYYRYYDYCSHEGFLAGIEKRGGRSAPPGEAGKDEGWKREGGKERRKAERSEAPAIAEKDGEACI